MKVDLGGFWDRSCLPDFVLGSEEVGVDMMATRTYDLRTDGSSLILWTYCCTCCACEEGIRSGDRISCRTALLVGDANGNHQIG